MSVTKRATVPLPKGFDPERHMTALNTKITEKLGSDWEVENIDREKNVATVVQHSAVTEVSTLAGERLQLTLPRGTTESDGKKLAATYSESYPGYFLTTFEPFNQRAILTKLDPDTQRTRELLANALGTNEWDVHVTPTADGGYAVKMPRTYIPSRHYDKIDDVVKTAIGDEGWYVTIDPRSRTGNIIPADPPTFPPGIPYPFTSTTITPTMNLTVGVTLPEPGQKELPPLTIDFSDAMAQVGGLAGSGKSVFLNDLIAAALEAGWELAIIDLPAKAVDFEWCKPFVRPNGWGCESAKGAVATLGTLYDEGQRRAGILREYHAKKLAELPENVRPAPILVIVDEATGLFAKETVPKTLPKTHPMRVEAEEQNIAVDITKMYINKIAAELRFVGLRLVLSSQVASRDTGIETKLRTNLHHKFLLGSNPTESNRKLIFPNADSVPLVPANVANDAKASRGVGTMQPEGAVARVFKPFYADTETLATHLTSIGVPTHAGQEPSTALIDQYMPSLDDDGDGGESASVKKRKALHEAAMTDPETGERLSGFEYANKQRAASVRKAEADALSGEGDVG